jgi:hypothetical protein
MKSARTIRILATAAVLFAAPGVALAQDAISAPAQKTIGVPAKSAMIPSLAVINSRGASLQGNTLTMTDVSSNSIVFADRPVGAAGHVLTKDFLKEWDEGSDSFGHDPPNATIRCSARTAGPSRTPSCTEIAEARWRQIDFRSVSPRRRPVEGDRARFALYRLVRGQRVWRSGFRRWWLPRRRMARRLVWSSCWDWRGGRCRWPRCCGGRRGSHRRLLSPLCLSLFCASAPGGLRLLPLPTLLLNSSIRPCLVLAFAGAG